VSDELETMNQRNELPPSVVDHEILQALKEAVRIMEIFHGLGMAQVVADHAWALYQQSPEMKRINAAIANAEAHAAAPQAERKSILVDRDAVLLVELRTYLDTLSITSDNIGGIRRSLFFPWDSMWNGWVRDETASRESPSSGDAAAPQVPLSAGPCKHERGTYRNCTLICDACGERVGDHFVHGMGGLRWDVNRIAIGHPAWDNKPSAPQVPRQETTE
jgi:hypothetical protein